MDNSFIVLIVLVIAFFGIMYFLTIRPQQKRQREHNALIAGLQRGDKVITAGGVYGEVELVEEESIVLKVEDGSKLRVSKYSIVRKQGE